ncbi:MAG TPA: AMP-binding protein [Pseudonocardiaceae bacterium]|nr:AMP-binding protein [Pseudonocardiaceae bacterium]
MLVGMLVQRAARRFAGRTALDGPQGTQTFGELGDRVARLAGGLLASGLRPGDRVLDLQPNQNTYIETDLACCVAGLVRVALNHRLHPDDWARIADDCGASALIYDARYAEPAQELYEGFGEARTVVIGDGPGQPYQKLLDASPEKAPPVAGTARADDLVSLNYTSGSTGAPKGVRRTHRVRFASLVNMLSDVLGGPPGPADVYLHAGPITHTSGLFVLPFLAYGSAQLILPGYDAAAVVDAVTRRGATHTALVPTMVARLSALGEPLPGLKMLGYAGAPMPPHQIRQAYERLTPHLVQYYGLVEAIPPVTVLDAADHAAGLTDRPELLASAGRPALGVELRVVDESGAPVPAGEIGEVVTRGDHVMPGYWAAAADIKAVDEAGWLHTGDLGRLDGRGRLWLIDRKGDMIITGGYNVYPREVEDVIAEVSGVDEVAVVGVRDPEWGQRIVALYRGTAEPDVVEAHCRARLASYKKPKEIRRVGSFPLNHTGKIAKNILKADLEWCGR